MPQQDMKNGLYQPRWRRMKEKPPAKHPHAAMKPAQHHEAAAVSWPAGAKAHRIDGVNRG